MKKCLSLIIIFCIVFYFVGCTSISGTDNTSDINPYLNPKDAIYVEEGTPWYSSVVTEYWNHNNQGGKSFVGCCSKYKVLCSENEVRTIEVYEGDSMEHTDITLDQNSFVENCFLYSEKLYVIYRVDIGDNTTNTIYEVDLEKGEFVNPIDIDISSIRTNAHDIKVEKVMTKDDKFFVEYSFYTDYMTEYGFIVMTSEGTWIKNFDTNEQINSWSLDENNNIVCFTYNGAVRINSETGTEEKLNINEEILEKYRNSNILDDGCAYIADSDTLKITRFNLNALKEEDLLDLNNCDASCFDVVGNDFVYGDGEKFILRKTHVTSIDELRDVVLIEISKASVNPHIGKQILTVASMDGLNPMCSQAVRDYNNNNSEYFIKIDMRYSPSNISSFNDNYYDGRLQAIDLLKQDIINGYGPDILIDYGSYPLLNYDEFLINTVPLIDGSNGLNREEYFNNIFEAFTIDDALYQIPLSANVEGIYVDNKYVNITGNSFSFDEYENHVSEMWDGFDPLQQQSTSSSYLYTAMNNNYYEFHDSDGLLHLNNDEFRAIAEFSSTLPEAFSDLGEEYHPVAEYMEFSNFQSEMIGREVYDNYSLYGMPSINESGPVAHIYNSAAITTCTASYEASWTFIKYMLSYDVQCKNTLNPINLLAWRDTAEGKVDNANKSMLTNGISVYDHSIIPVYESYLLSATTPAATDVYLMTFINEEIQAYYSGQKSLDDVIAIVENRVNTMVNERGY